MNRKRLYPTLKMWREDRQWTQRDAARYLGVTQATYSRMERHIHAPRPARAKVLSAQTGVPLESILGIAG